MDSEFLALSLFFILVGAAGIVLFYGPMNAAGDSCYCLIPSPEPGAAQGTSSIILALGILFFPMGLMKGGLPSFTSGRLLAAGIVLVVLGADAVVIPGYLVLKSVPITEAGVLVTALGFLGMYLGFRKPKV